jgi:uncharacterized membrane protein
MYERLPKLARFYIYGVQGIVTEVIYTALWEFIAKGSWKWIGISSTWAFIIYGLTTLFIEHIKPYLISRNIKLPIRAFIYMLCIFIWEFSTGYTLKLFNACPWDYSEWFNWNIMGLITLEYAPLWYFGSIVSEQFVIPLTNRLHWQTDPDLARPRQRQQQQVHRN